jgi:hypothetical protein
MEALSCKKVRPDLCDDYDDHDDDDEHDLVMMM